MYKSISSFKFVSMLYFYCDILAKLQTLVKQLQKDKLLPYEVDKYVQTTIASIKSDYLTGDEPRMGAHVSEFVVQLNSCINNNPNVTDNNYTYMLGEHGITFSKAKVDMFIQWMRRVATSVIATLNMRFPKEEFFDSLKFIDPTYLRSRKIKAVDMEWRALRLYVNAIQSF